MRQLLQSLKTGEIELLETPCPAVGPGQVLIQSTVSLISAGTERMLLEFGKASLLQKARQQPDRVREVMDKVRTQGLLPTLEAVRSKLNEQIPLGYCSVGTVLDVGSGVADFAPGDRVISNGSHAEVVCVPQNLCAKIPDVVSDQDAAFTVVGAIGLQGVRLAEPTLGECFVVTGLGLIGLLTVQLLVSNGCRVLGIDFDPRRLELARRLGAEAVGADEAVLDVAKKFSRGRGVDGVLVTASCKSDEPMHQAAQMCRKRGRIVLVGVSGLNLQRSDFYEKELSFRVSCSYGPGRYDPQYEQQGVDYPIGFVRWTEQRNFEAVLDQFATGKMSAGSLVTHEFGFSDVADAYAAVAEKSGSLGVLLKYDTEPKVDLRRDTVAVASVGKPQAAPAASGHVKVAVIGAGNFSQRMLIPNLKRAGAEVTSIASRAGLTAAIAARSQQVSSATTDWRSAIQQENVTAVAIATRHDSHAHIAAAALDAGKHVFVEKPLALTAEQLQTIEAAVYEHPELRVMVGFNRRFAPSIEQICAAVRREAQPKAFVMTVNAGELPPDHWTHDSHVGGGRILGEGCHFVDLLRHLAGHTITRVQATMISQTEITTDKMSINLSFADGSIGTIHYLGNGSKSFPKERLEVFCNGQILQLDNYRRLRSYGWRGVKSRRYWKQDLGHRSAINAFVQSIETSALPPIPFVQLKEVTEVCFDIMTAAETGQTIERSETVQLYRRSA